MGRRPCQPANRARWTRKRMRLPKGQLSGNAVGPPFWRVLCFQSLKLTAARFRHSWRLNTMSSETLPSRLKSANQSSALAAACKRNRAESSAYITACNPGSKPLDDSANAERHSRCAASLLNEIWHSLRGLGNTHRADGLVNPAFSYSVSTRKMPKSCPSSCNKMHLFGPALTGYHS
jgi:hypothetical protein